jgi:fructosamine-3-kinase
VRRVTPVSGGSINLSAKVDTTGGVYFLKSNDTFRYPQMFEKEARGLETLREVNTLSIPKVIMTGEDEGNAFLMLEFIEMRTKQSGFWKSFGKGLADLHRITNERF